MQVDWTYRSFDNGCGHGVEVSMSFDDDIRKRSGDVLAFIDGFSWIHDQEPMVVVFLNDKLKRFPQSLTMEIRLAILLFLTDKKRQTRLSTEVHGFTFWVNG